MKLPKHPVYVPSRGRADERLCSTAHLLAAAGVPFTLVVEPGEFEEYARTFADTAIHKLADDGRGVAYARQSVLELARSRGQKYFWQIDDNFQSFGLRTKTGKKIKASVAEVLAIVEELVEGASAAMGSPDFAIWPRPTKDDRVENSYAVCCTLASTSTGLNYDGRFLCREDIDLCAATILAGHKIVRSLRATMTKKKMGSVGGGLQSVLKSRVEAELHDDALLKEKYGDLVTLREGKRAVVRWKDVAASVPKPRKLAAVLPRYPIYIPSKGRHESSLTAKCLVGDGVPFFLVVEPQEREAYTAKFGPERVLVLPFRDPGSVIPARNWIKDHATAAGHERHWQLDDNIAYFGRVWKGQRLRCEAGVAMRVVEDFVDRYENVAIAGLNYYMFFTGTAVVPPFFLNNHVYSCTLVNNAIPHRWRGAYNEDTDMCLQVLADGWCTVLFNAFLVQKKPTMVMRGGNTAALYQGDGRLKMARSLERLWPGVVSTGRRFKRPQHVVADSWKRFDTPLKLKPGVDLAKIAPNDYGLSLVEVRKPKSRELRRIVAAANNKSSGVFKNRRVK